MWRRHSLTAHADSVCDSLYHRPRGALALALAQFLRMCRTASRRGGSPPKASKEDTSAPAPPKTDAKPARAHTAGRLPRVHQGRPATAPEPSAMPSTACAPSHANALHESTLHSRASSHTSARMPVSAVTAMTCQLHVTARRTSGVCCCRALRKLDSARGKRLLQLQPTTVSVQSSQIRPGTAHSPQTCASGNAGVVSARSPSR